MGRQPSVERTPRLLGQGSLASLHAKDGQKSQRHEFLFEEPFVAAPKDAPMIRTPTPSIENVPRLLGQERALAIPRTYSEKDGQKSQEHKYDFEERMAALNNAPIMRIEGQDPQAGIPRGIYKSGLKWGGW